MIPQPHPCLPYLCNTSSYMQLNWCGITYCENILVMPKLLSERNIPSQLYAWFDLLKIFGCEMHAFQTLSRGGKNKAKLVSTTFPASGCRYLLIGHLNKLHAEGSVDCLNTHLSVSIFTLGDFALLEWSLSQLKMCYVLWLLYVRQSPNTTRNANWQANWSNWGCHKINSMIVSWYPKQL